MDPNATQADPIGTCRLCGFEFFGADVTEFAPQIMRHFRDVHPEAGVHQLVPPEALEQ